MTFQTNRKVAIKPKIRDIKNNGPGHGIYAHLSNQINVEIVLISIRNYDEVEHNFCYQMFETFI